MQLKLRASIVLAVIVGLLIPMTVSSLFTLGEREDMLTRDLIADHQRTADILALGMQQPLWNLSPESGRPLFDSLQSDPRVTAMSVRDQRFGPFLSSEHPERRKGRQFTLNRNVVYDHDVIGYVSVEIDSGELDASIARDRAHFEMTALAQLLLSIVLIVSLLQVRLLAPLRQLIRQSQQIARRELSEPFEWDRNDELGSLGRSLESSRQALQQLFSAIETQNRELESDIERRRVTEQELQRHREHLEELVKGRTAELTIAKERAEVANQAKTTFLASMSHELRTPLNAVLGYTQLLKRDKNLTTQQRAILDTIQQSGEHLLTLITDLLDLAKIEAGKFELHETTVDLPAFLRVIVDIIRVKAKQKHLAFSFETKPDLPQVVLVDDLRLRQVLLNLLGNAVKFTDHGEVSLHVGSRSAGLGQTRLCFEVRDTGIGLESEQFETIFLPFEQVGEVRRRYGGTGLGLSISRQLVRMMHSDIHVESAPGRGSVFRFELLVRAPATELAMPVVQDRTGEQQDGPASDERYTPPLDQIERLHQLAMAGNMRAIREFAAQIAELDPCYRGFADRLDLLARDYQSKAIVQLAEQSLHAAAK